MRNWKSQSRPPEKRTVIRNTGWEEGAERESKEIIWRGERGEFTGILSFVSRRNRLNESHVLVLCLISQYLISKQSYHFNEFVLCPFLSLKRWPRTWRGSRLFCLFKRFLAMQQGWFFPHTYNYSTLLGTQNLMIRFSVELDAKMEKKRVQFEDHTTTRSHEIPYSELPCTELQLYVLVSA